MIDFIWHSVAAQIGIGGVAVAGLLAVAWFFPVFRRLALMAAVITFTIIAAFAKGARDAKRRERERQAEEERKAIARGNKARSDAQRDVSTGRVRDKWDRDDL